MIIGKVVGSVISTRKCDALIGCKFMVVEPVGTDGAGRFVAVDMVGAGIGEAVMVARGSAARVGYKAGDTPIDAAIVGIIDEDSDWRSVVK